MSTSYGQFTLSPGGNRPRTAPAAAAVLWSVGLALMLAASRAPAAPGDQTAKAAPGEQTVEEKPKSIVAVFRLEGPVTEAPADDLEQIFGQPGVSLKDRKSTRPELQ